MIHPRIDQLLDQVDSRYALVIVAAKRARQINNYHHQLGEGTFDEFPPPLVRSRSKNYLTMSLEEDRRGQDQLRLPAVAVRAGPTRAGSVTSASRVPRPARHDARARFLAPPPRVGTHPPPSRAILRARV